MDSPYQFSGQCQGYNPTFFFPQIRLNTQHFSLASILRRRNISCAILVVLFSTSLKEILVHRPISDWICFQFWSQVKTYFHLNCSSRNPVSTQQLTILEAGFFLAIKDSKYLLTGFKLPVLEAHIVSRESQMRGEGTVH